MRAIQPGEEVTTSYTELAATRWERRRELLRHHQFDIDADAANKPAADGAAATGVVAAGGSNEGAVGDGSAAASLAAAASGAAAGGSSAAALQCLPAQPPAAVLPLVGGTADLRLYSCQPPPWPHDERDAALTALVAAPGGGAANGCGSGSSCAWGGMWGSLGQPDDTSLAATPASASFDVAADLAGDGDEAAAQQPGSAAGPSSGASGGQPAASPVVHSWAAAGSVQQGSGLQAVQHLADAYLAALQLQQALDGMLAEGQAATAVQRLQQSLAALADRPSSNGSSSSSSDGEVVGRLALGPRHVLRMRLLADLHRAAVAAEQWQTALAAVYELLPLYREVYLPVRVNGAQSCLGPLRPLWGRKGQPFHPVYPFKWALLLLGLAWFACLQMLSATCYHHALCFLRSAWLAHSFHVDQQVWPQLGLLWAAVAKLEHLQERPSQAIQAAEQALHILTTTHGGSGPAAEAMRQVLFEAQQEAALRGGGGWRPALAAEARSDSDE